MRDNVEINIACADSKQKSASNDKMNELYDAKLLMAFGGPEQFAKLPSLSFPIQRQGENDHLLNYFACPIVQESPVCVVRGCNKHNQPYLLLWANYDNGSPFMILVQKTGNDNKWVILHSHPSKALLITINSIEKLSSFLFSLVKYGTGYVDNVVPNFYDGAPLLHKYRINIENTICQKGKKAAHYYQISKSGIPQLPLELFVQIFYFVVIKEARLSRFIKGFKLEVVEEDKTKESIFHKSFLSHCHFFAKREKVPSISKDNIITADNCSELIVSKASAETKHHLIFS